MSDKLTSAQESYREFMDAMRDQRTQIDEDLRFSDPSNPQQWDEAIKLAREKDPGGKRPCHVFDQTGQYVANVAGQVEQAPPSLHAIPISGGADKKTAEYIDGRFRHIEHASRAASHYKTALTSAARVGVGYLVVRPVLTDVKMRYKEPRISCVPDALKVLFDPWSTETDGSDASEAFILTDMSNRAFEERWPKKDLVGFGDLEQLKTNSDRKEILIAEHFKKVVTTRPMVMYEESPGIVCHGTKDEYDEESRKAGAAYPVLNEYKEKNTKVVWSLFSGADCLEESEYPCEYIGIVPMYGYVGFANGRMTYCGIPRRARDAQQAYNYHASELKAYIGTQPKAPWIASIRAVKGHEHLWDAAAAQSRAFLPYNDMDEMGAIQPPVRTPVSTSLVNHEMGLQQASRDIQASIGMYQANLGQKSNETSGVAIETRKQSGEANTAHFPSHMAASIGQIGNIVMHMDAKLADTRRPQPTMRFDQTPETITVDPEQKESYTSDESGAPVINPNVGKYGVRVVVGASFTTQRAHTNVAMTEIMRSNKEIAPVIAPFWAQTLDFPGADKFSQAMAAMAPAPVKAVLSPEGEPQDPAILSAEVERLKQALQEATQLGSEAQDDADTAMRALADKTDKEKIEWYKAATDRLKVTGANVDQVEAIITDMLPDLLGVGPKPDGAQPEQAGMPQMPMQAEQPPMQPMPEQPEAEPMEPEMPEEPEGPSETEQAILAGQEEIKAGLAMIAELLRKPRVRTPERDKSGLITRVVDSLDDQQTLQ